MGVCGAHEEEPGTRLKHLKSRRSSASDRLSIYRAAGKDTTLPLGTHCASGNQRKAMASEKNRSLSRHEAHGWTGDSVQPFSTKSLFLLPSENARACFGV